MSDTARAWILQAFAPHMHFLFHQHVNPEPLINACADALRAAVEAKGLECALMVPPEGLQSRADLRANIRAHAADVPAPKEKT